jgi:hypothetical protein
MEQKEAHQEYILSYFGSWDSVFPGNAGRYYKICLRALSTRGSQPANPSSALFEGFLKGH